MCEPTTVLTIASTAFSFVQQAQQASQNDAAIEAAYNNSLIGYAQQQKQINAAATDEMSDRAREALIERGRLRVAAAESGVTGNSTDQLERQSLFDEGFDMARIEGNRKNAQAQAYQDAKAGQAGAQSRVASVKRPSLIGAGLQIAGAYAQGEADKAARERGIPRTSRYR